MISNLIRIYSEFSGMIIEEIEKKFKGKGYVEFKESLAELVIEKLQPIQSRREEVLRDKSIIKNSLLIGIEKAKEAGEKTMEEIREAVFQYKKRGLF